MPENQPHDTDSPNCWCIPYIQKICPYCEDCSPETVVSCKFCAGEGWIQATVEDYYDENTPTITVHNEFQ